MNTTKHALLFLLLVAVFVGASQAITYLWFTESEVTSFGDMICFIGDTVDGPVRSNSAICARGGVFLDSFITTGDCRWGFDRPIFAGPPPRCNAPRGIMPRWPESVSYCAQIRGNYFPWSGSWAKVVFAGSTIRIYRWNEGVPFDSTWAWQQTIPVTNPICLYFDCTVWVRGILTGQVTLGSSHRIYIEDDVRYSDADSLTGSTPTTSRNLLALVAADDIKVSNTPANGRWNSGGRGPSQTNRDSTSVVITALLYAGNSFTFDQQNDPDSGYVYDGGRDDRGTVYVYGGIYQMQRGYMHRSNLGSTGYLKRYRYDQRLRHTLPWGLYDAEIAESGTTDTLDFGEVAVGTTAWDTAHVYPYSIGSLGAVYASYPFWATRTPPFEGTHFVIPVRFTPPGVGQYQGLLSVGTVAHYYQIPLRGRGVVPSGSGALVMNVAPNPFNAQTMIRFSLPQAGKISLDVFDVTGRKVMTVVNGDFVAGEQAVSLNCSNLASGVYFVRMQVAHRQTTLKIALIR